MTYTDNPNQLAPTSGSWLYLITTSGTWPPRTKIGMTRHNPMDRFATLRCGDPYLCFHVAFYIPGTCPLQAAYFERRLHAVYGTCRIDFHNGGPSEWFNVHFKEAEIQCEQFIENQFDEQDWLVSEFNGYAYALGTSILKAYEDDLLSFFGRPPVLDEDGIPW